MATLDGFGCFARAELAAAGAILGYLELTCSACCRASTRRASCTQRRSCGIDPATRRNLELLAGLDGGREGSLSRPSTAP
ncbi:MAG: hypothetical protein U1E17_01540 [Geminicoccaceae bacterium]